MGPLRHQRKGDPTFVSELRVVGNCIFAGYVYNSTDLTCHYTLEVIIDGLVFDTIYANDFVADIPKTVPGDGCYGFHIALPRSVFENAQCAEFRIANLDIAVGLPFDLTRAPFHVTPLPPQSRLIWLGGLRFHGWLLRSQSTVPTLTASVDGESVMQVRANSWAHSPDVAYGLPCPAFDFHLPQRFSDGRARYLTIHDGNGSALQDSPVFFVAFEDGLAATISSFGVLESEKLRGVRYDSLFPMSMPMAHYDHWKQRFAPPAPKKSSECCAIVLLGDHSLTGTLESLNAQTHDNWTACVASVQSNSGCHYNLAILREFMNDSLRDIRYFIFAPAGTRFEPHAIGRFIEGFESGENAKAVYADYDFLNEDSTTWPLAFPAFDYERMLEQGYCSRIFAVRHDVVASALQHSITNIHRLFNHLFDEGMNEARNIIHLPGTVATLPLHDPQESSSALLVATAEHLDARGLSTVVTPTKSTILPAVRVERPLRSPRTTVIIVNRNRVDSLRECIASIMPSVAFSNADLLVIDNHSNEEGTLEFLEQYAGGRNRVINVPGPLNLSRISNIAATETDAEFLCLLNSDVRARDAQWLSEMLSRASEPDVGAVGAMLLWPSGVVQHGGVVLGSAFTAAHAFSDRLEENSGYCDLLNVAHECSAVTGSCLLTRRSDYLQVGGLDDVFFPAAFNDIDYCLRLRALGKRVIFTPYARLIYTEPPNRRQYDRLDIAARIARERETLRARWGDILVEDPFYSPALSLDQIPFSALSWPPRSMKPRSNKSSNPRNIPAGY